MTGTATSYDRQWEALDDFIEYNPGARHRRRISRRLLRGLRFSTCLDVGCGNGRFIRDLLAMTSGTAAVTGVDGSAWVVEANRLRIPDARFHQLDIEREALPSRFDLIVCAEVIEHLADRRRAFAHIAGMLNPGGHLLITCPTGRVHATERHFGHVSHPTREEVLALGEAHRLRAIHVSNWGWPTYRALKFMTNLNPRRTLEVFASGRYSGPQKAVCHALYALNYLNAADSPRGCQLFVLFRNES